MAYPRNAASPPPVAIGAVVQISDGAVQTTGVTVYHRTSSTTENSGGGTTNVGATTGTIYYTPTQAETNYESFELVAWKTGCIPACVTVVTSASATAGVSVIPDTQKVDVNTIKTQTITCSGGVTVPAATLASTTNITSANGVTLTPTTGLGNQTANITGTVSGNSTHSAADVKTAIEAAGSHLTLILEDTGTTLPSTLSTILTDTDELQKAITDGGRTDLLIDAIKAKTDLMLAAADIRTAVGLAAANLDTQIATLATAANLATLDTLVDRMAPLLVGTVTGAGTGTEVYAYGGVTATVTVDVDGNVSGVVFS